MKHAIALLILFICAPLFAQDLGRSEKRKLEDALKNIEIAEKSDSSKDFQRAYKKVESNVKSLKRKFADHPQVIGLEKKLELLKPIAELEDLRSNLEQAMKKMQGIYQRMKSGRSVSQKEIDNYINIVQSCLFQLQKSENSRFSNTISAAENVLTEGKNLGIEITSQEEIARELELEKALESLNYGQKKVVASLEKSLKNAQGAENYNNLTRSLEQAKENLEELQPVLENIKIQDLQNLYNEQQPRILIYKTYEDTMDNVRKIASKISELRESVAKAVDTLNTVSIDLHEDSHVISRSASILNNSLSLLVYCKQNLSEKMEEIRNAEKILSKAKNEKVSDAIDKALEVIEKWTESFAEEESLRSKSETIGKKIALDMENELSSIQNKIANISQTPKELTELLKVFEESIKKAEYFFKNFENVPVLTQLNVKVIETETLRKKYIKFLNEYERIHEYLKYANTNDYVEEHLKNSKNMIEEDQHLQKMYEYYQEIFTRMKKANNELERIKAEMIKKIMGASESAKNKGFIGFQNSLPAVEPNRRDILKNLEVYTGKPIKGLVWEELRGDGRYGWHLDHGDDRFVYVWDKETFEVFEKILKYHEETFDKFRKEVFQKYNIQLENEGNIRWSFLGFHNMDIVALVDAQSSYRPKRTAKDNYGNTITFEGDPVQIVQVRMIAFTSKYYTYWPNGTSMNNEVDFSNINH